MCASKIYVNLSLNESSAPYKKIPLKLFSMPTSICSLSCIAQTSPCIHTLAHDAQLPKRFAIFIFFLLFFRSLIHIFLSCECVHNMRSDHDRFGIFCCVFLLHFYVVLLKVCSFDPENTAITWDRRRKNKPSGERRLKENRLLIWITMPNYHHIHCTRFKIWHFAYTTFFRQRMKQHQHECRARL